MCLPENIGVDDVKLHAKLAGTASVANDEFQHVDSINEVFNDQTMSKIFLDER